MEPCDEECSSKGIPGHLHQLAQLVDSGFLSEELLYCRFKFYEADLTAVIKFNRMSVNRGKFCKSPDDVLWNDKIGGRYENVGVVQFPVSALQGSWAHPNDKQFPVTYSLEPEHKPERCNYPHSEVVTMELNRETGTSTSVSKIKPPSVKLEIREHLQSLVTIALPIDRSGETLPIEPPRL